MKDEETAEKYWDRFQALITKCKKEKINEQKMLDFKLLVFEQIKNIQSNVKQRPPRPQKHQTAATTHEDRLHRIARV